MKVMGKLIELFARYILHLRLLSEYSTLKGTDTDKYVGKTEHLNMIAKIFIKKLLSNFSNKWRWRVDSNSTLPFLGKKTYTCSTNIHMLRLRCTLQPTNTGLLLHFKSHVEDRYKRGLLKTMLDRVFRLSSNCHYFSEECDRLKLLFSRLKYPDKLVNS